MKILLSIGNEIFLYLIKNNNLYIK